MSDALKVSALVLEMIRELCFVTLETHDERWRLTLIRRATGYQSSTFIGSFSEVLAEGLLYSRGK